ncbi:MAG: hypothetical protein LUO79_08945, partial [Methanomassiliicoccales archaeon]|nr:hypothetical protein [Methanomassiliicoccales archaeon]
WGLATPIGIDTGNFYGIFPKVAIDDSGTSVAIWVNHVSLPIGQGYFQLNSNRHSSEGWSGPAPIGDDSAIWEPYTSQVAMDGNGNAIVVWQDMYLGVCACRFSDGDWGPEVRLGNYSGGGSSTPQVAMCENGDAFVIWSQDYPDYSIDAARYSAGSWGAATRISVDQGNFSVIPEIATDRNGNAIVVWMQMYTYTGGTVQALIYTAAKETGTDMTPVAVVVVVVIVAGVAGALVLFRRRR